MEKRTGRPNKDDAMKDVGDVLTALKLCGSNYYAGACKKCPFIKECMPGENDALIDAAAEVINDLVKLNAFSLKEQSKLLSVLKYAKVTVYIVVHRKRSNSDVWMLKTGHFRLSDMKKLDKTVFLEKAAAEKALRRLQHGGK